MKSFIDSIVLENGTYFIHPSTYPEEDMPSAYQDAVSVCALYRQVTPRNQQRVFQILNNKVNLLIQDSITTSWNVSEILLAVQSLILYQVIRIFDGDSTQRNNAELHFKLLGIWTGYLQRAYPEAEQTSFLRTPYQQWVLLESIRRTVMTSVLLRSLYCTVRTGICDLVHLLAILPVSSNGTLWKVDESKWVEEMNSGGACIDSFRGFIINWNSGNVVKIEGYEKVLLSACPSALGTSVWALSDTE
ncbi:hypothetical protein BP6252_04303 [Coleophoma cylindrospora]|uniref:Transcription factor domain-containing protein n=1 Tax=Coleophoma cylindrospora TaxID=1849047 RepID=A0A3D8S045_9HELO|nr:hypothetical protein BP6252_04303 [Coleophoma cylindrospora]